MSPAKAHLLQGEPPNQIKNLNSSLNPKPTQEQPFHHWQDHLSQLLCPVDIDSEFLYDSQQSETLKSPYPHHRANWHKSKIMTSQPTRLEMNLLEKVMETNDSNSVTAINQSGICTQQNYPRHRTTTWQ